MTEAKTWWNRGMANIILKDGHKGERWELSESEFEVLQWALGFDGEDLVLLRRAAQSLGELKETS